MRTTRPRSVSPGWCRNASVPTGLLVSVVAGALTEGKRGWDWENFPIDPRMVAEGARGDALMARQLIDHFDLDRVDWCHIIWKAEKLLRRQDFRRLVVRIAAELERVEVLHADQIRALMEPEAVAA